jgi:hypothetical protein
VRMRRSLFVARRKYSEKIEEGVFLIKPKLIRMN